MIPINKNRDKKIVSKYKPVSLLPQFSKTLLGQNTICKKTNQLLKDHQYGFRNNRATSLAVMEFVESIATVIDKKQHAEGVFIDLLKAFDRVNHSPLLHKLGHCGIRGVAHQ